MTLLFSWSQSSFSAEPEKINDSALQEIRSLVDEKLSRSTADRKLDSQFVFQLKLDHRQVIAQGVTKLRPDVKFQADGRILVDIDANVTKELLGQINDSGGTVVNSFPQFRAIRALVSLDQLESLAGLEDVKFIRRADEALTNTGRVNSQGDLTHRANVARSTYGFSGAGVRVGVLSDSMDFLANSQITGDLPPDVTVLPGQAGIGKGEGTAMHEIIYDLAPGAQLYFATAFNSAASFAQNILDLRSNGCDVIVDDVAYFNESPFQDGIIARSVNAVTAGGALYFSAAGNSGNQDDGTSGTWEGDFVNGGPAGPPVNVGAGTVHSFGPVTYNTVLSGGSSLRVDLFWSDPLQASDNDYDLFVLDSTGASVLRSSLNLQDGTQDPYESVSFLNVGERIVIVKASGVARFLHLETGRGRLSISTAGNTKGHSAATNAFSVAAVSAVNSYPGPFVGGSLNPVETFSSDGPRRVFFNADGTPITPGNFSSTGGSVRQKPDIAAADEVFTSVPGFQTFSGTSAAAAHATAISALLVSYNRELTPNQIRAALASTALDIEAVGVDRDTGAGIIMPAEALHGLAPLENDLAVRMSALPDPVVVGGNLMYLIEVSNAGPSAATNVTLTNLLPASVTLLSVTNSQGASVNSNGTVICNLGLLRGGSNATVAIVGMPSSVGFVTNRVNVSRAEVDPNPANNAATAVTTVVALPSLSINDLARAEGDFVVTQAVFTVSLSTVSVQPVSVNYVTASISATAGTDYVSTNGTLVFPPGVTNQAVAVLVNGDTVNEANETFSVNLSSPENATLSDSLGRCTILNDDRLPTVSISDSTVTEGNSGTTGAVFTVSLSAVSGQAVSVSYSTSNGVASAGSDYISFNSTFLTFAPGQTNKTITVAVTGDLTVELDETFYVYLSAPSNVKIAKAQGVGTIVNDDGLPGQLHHFSWSPISSPQSVGEPFAVTLTAQDYFNNTVADFTDVAALSGNETSPDTTTFGDNFEDGNFSDWTIGLDSVTRQITSLASAGGTNSFTIIGGQQQHYRGISHALAHLTPDQITFYVRGSSASASGGYFVAGTSTANSGTAVFFHMDDDGTMGIFEDVGGFHATSYAANQWYKITLLFSWQTKGVDYYVNDTLVEPNIPFRGPTVSSLSILSLYNFDNTQNWWDEIQLVQHGIQTSVPITPTSSSNFVSGVWYGAITVQQLATNLVLKADGGLGRSGQSQSFDVLIAPKLSIARSGDSILLSWPTAATGFALERTPSLSSQTSWVPVRDFPIVAGDSQLVTNAVSTTNIFYRLRPSP